MNAHGVGPVRREDLTERVARADTPGVPDMPSPWDLDENSAPFEPLRLIAHYTRDGLDDVTAPWSVRVKVMGMWRRSPSSRSFSYAAGVFTPSVVEWPTWLIDFVNDNHPTPKGIDR